MKIKRTENNLKIVSKIIDGLNGDKNLFDFEVRYNCLTGELDLDHNTVRKIDGDVTLWKNIEAAEYRDSHTPEEIFSSLEEEQEERVEEWLAAQSLEIS